MPALTGAIAAFCVLGAAGCFTDADNRQPDPTRLYFPTGLKVSPGGNTLYVANSDFDLKYSGGTVMALDLTRLRRDVTVVSDSLATGSTAAAACSAAGRTTNPDPWLNPGPCSAFSVGRYIRSSAFIGAFASGLLLAHEPDGGSARLFVPVRGDPSITYFEVQDDRGADASFSPTYRLDCQAGSDGFCSDDHRLGRDPDHTLRSIQLPADPVGIAATADGVAIVTAHQTQGAASLIINDWGNRPVLSYFMSNLSSGPTELVNIPEPAFVPLARERAAAAGGSFTYQSGFALTFRSSAELDVLRYVPDAGAVPPRPFLVRAAAVPISTAASSFDSRGIAVVDTERRQCETSCDTAVNVLACNAACAEEVPLRLYMANRHPASLLIGQLETFINYSGEGDEEVITSADETVFFHDSVPLNYGASRVEVNRVIDADGKLSERVFAVCFDTRSVFIFNPFEQRIEAVVHTGRGPHDVGFDVGVSDSGKPYAYLYVGHFTDSYIGVVGLDMRRPLSYGQMFASVGMPTPPEEAR